MPHPDPERHPVQDLDDEELNRYILARLSIAGVDLSVLPEEDEDAPADRVRVLRSARNFLRSSVPEISNFTLDPQEAPPALYPSALFPVLGTTSSGGGAGPA